MADSSKDNFSDAANAEKPAEPKTIIFTAEEKARIEYDARHRGGQHTPQLFIDQTNALKK